jgi:PhnB protein
VRPVADQFYGDRVGGIEDPFGYRWVLATRKEDLTMEEIRRRAAAQGS